MTKFEIRFVKDALDSHSETLVVEAEILVNFGNFTELRDDSSPREVIMRVNNEHILWIRPVKAG